MPTLSPTYIPEGVNAENPARHISGTEYINSKEVQSGLAIGSRAELRRASTWTKQPWLIPMHLPLLRAGGPPTCPTYPPSILSQ